MFQTIAYIQSSDSRIRYFVPNILTVFPTVSSPVYIYVIFFLGQLSATLEMTAKEKKTKNNKSPGVDGIPSRLLIEAEEQIHIRLPLAIFQLALPYIFGTNITINR